ncbi:transcriptional regulator, partial [Bacillus cereus]
LTKKEAQKYLDFQIKTPPVVVNGFKLAGEEVQTSLFPGRKNPVIVSEYHRGDSLSWYVVNQSIVRDKEENPFYGIMEESEKITNYELEGANITFAESSESNTKYMEAIVPAKGKNSDYQVIILANDVSKEELEKVMLSYIN